MKYENILSWFDNDFVLTVIETAYVTFAFRSKPCCNMFLKFNIRAFWFYGKAFQILGPFLARLLSPKVADLRVLL